MGMNGTSPVWFAPFFLSPMGLDLNAVVTHSLPFFFVCELLLKKMCHMSQICHCLGGLFDGVLYFVN